MGGSMSLRGAADLRTLCEVLREINDALQGNEQHEVVLPLLVEAEGMAKKMSRKLYDNNRKYDEGWWKANPGAAQKIERRLNEHYISG